MASKPNERARDANGRFVRRRVLNQKSEGTGQIALLTVAIILGVVGLALHLLWVAALVLLGILWGSMAAERQRRTRGGRGVIAEVVDVVVEQAKDVADAAHAKPIKQDED